MRPAGPRHLPHPGAQPDRHRHGRLLGPEALAREIGDLADAGRVPEAIAYCGGGVPATLVVFALALLGRDDIRLCDG